MPTVIDSFDTAPDMPHEERVSTDHPFQGQLINVRVDTVRLPSGKESTRELVEHPGSVVIVPVTADGNVIFIRQYRYATSDYLLELPAGLIDEGERPRAAAMRELVEEVSHEAGSMRELCTVYISPGYTEEITTIFLAEGCTPVAAEDDEDEPIQMLFVPLANIPGMLTEGDQRVADAQTMLGMLWLIRLELA